MFDGNVIVWVLLAAVVGLFFYMRFASIKGVRNIGTEQFAKELNEGGAANLLIDVRELHEFKRSHIRGATNIPLSQLGQRIKDIPLDKSLFLYCQSGMRSRQAARALSKQGYKNIANLNGGIMSWRGQTVQ